MRHEWKLHFGFQCSRLKICHCRQVEPVKPKRAYHQPSRELRSWVVEYALLNKEGREPRYACDVLIPILRQKCGRVDAVHLQQSGRATWHDTQIRHTMDPPSKQDGRGALLRHDLDGRDHDRHHHCWRAPCNEVYKKSRIFPTAHLDPAAPEAGHAILCRVRVPGQCGA